MKKRRTKSAYHRAAFTGYGEHRYGKARKVTLAPILTGERRERVAEQVASVLKSWSITPFQHEANLVHGLRSVLCLEGHRFARCEAEAFQLVADGLRRIGAKRPTWEQGQPDFVEPRENCAVCGRLTDDGRHIGLKARRYCSDVCAKADFERKDFERRNETDHAYAAAYRMIRRAQSKGRNCVQCGGEFRPVREAGTQRFCSQLCGSRHSAKMRCDASPRVDRVCECCGDGFRAKNPRARRCSDRCNQIIAKFEKGKPPVRISPPVFDYVFKMAA